MDSDKIIALVTLQMIKDAVCSNNNNNPYIRIRNLTRESFLQIANIWPQFILGNDLEKVRLLVSNDADPEFPDEFRADSDKSITWYRNITNDGFVYLETKSENDSQGMKSIFSITDRDFLEEDEFFTANGLRPAESIINEAWAITGSKSTKIHTLLRKNLLKVLDLLHPDTVMISVKKFANFALNTCKEYRAVQGTVDVNLNNKIVGTNLIHLGFFPDEYWNENSLDSKTSRRLETNSLHSDLSTKTGDIDIPKLSEKIKDIRFKNDEGNFYSERDQEKWKNLCKQYLENTSEVIRKKIPYKIFEQLFSQNTKGLKLGDRVLTEIEENDISRVSELQEMDIIEGLNNRRQDDAQTLINHKPLDENKLPLPDVISTTTRRMVEKAANPNPERFINPVIKLAEIIKNFRERAKSNYNYPTVIFKVKGSEENPTIGLFSFIYGQTLDSICNSSGSDYLLKIDQILSKPVTPPEYNQEIREDEDEDELEFEWPPLRFECEILTSDGETILDSEGPLEWNPPSIEKLALFWIAVAGNDRPDTTFKLYVGSESKLDAWIKNVALRATPMNSSEYQKFSESVLNSQYVVDLINARKEFLSDTSVNGLDHIRISNYFSKWENIICSAKTDLITDGQSDESINCILSQDCIFFDNLASFLMLPTHPFKLRWISFYLQESKKLLDASLNGTLKLHADNGSFYLNWFSSLSPHQQPAIGCDQTDGNGFVFASNENGWCEEFYTMESESSSKVTSDHSAILQISDSIKSYLEFHPYKKDGISLLTVISDDYEFPSKLMNALKTGQWKKLHVEFHIFAPQKIWEDICRELESLPSENRLNAEGSKLSPPLDVRLHELSNEGIPGNIIKSLKCDLAVVPQFVSTNTTIQDSTQIPTSTIGGFKPLMDSPTYVYGGESGGSITVSLKPENNDEALYSWSTMVVRQRRTRPVSPSQPENFDYLELMINFAHTARVFKLVHNAAHWVITTERYVRREQIESLEPRPDILTVRENIGTNGIYTLIISSNSGQRFILERLSRKIARITSSNNEDYVNKISKQIYDETRLISPKLALQAMGISRATEEILGVSIARKIAEKMFPSRPETGLVVWISLDEHIDWFRGISAERADMVRVTFELKGEDKELNLEILIMEAKLRQAYDAHGELQVFQTIKLFNSIKPSDTKEKLIDSNLWRERLVTAVDQVSPDAKKFFGKFDNFISKEDFRLPSIIKYNFIDGNFRLKGIRGIYSLCRYDSESELNISNIERDNIGITVVRTYRNHIEDILNEKIEITENLKFQNNVSYDNNSHTKPVTKEITGPNEYIESMNKDIKDEDQITNQKKTHEGKLRKRSGIGQDTLQSKYQTILDILGGAGIKVFQPDDSQDRFVEGPASILFRIKLDSGVEPKSIYSKSELLKINLKLASDQEINCGQHLGLVTLDVPKSDEERYFVTAQELWENWKPEKNKLMSPFGTDRYGKVVSINFSASESPHLLIGGTTGSGKSEALKTILCGLTEYYSEELLQLKLIDPKMVELFNFQEYPHVSDDIGHTADDAISILQQAVEEMQERYKKFQKLKVNDISKYNDKVTSEKLSWWVIVLDEYSQLTTKKDNKISIEALLEQLAQMARAAGIHVIIATQKPSAAVISTTLRANLPSQLALRVKSSIESRVIMDEQGAETLIGKGDSFFKCGSELTRVQCAYVCSDNSSS